MKKKWSVLAYLIVIGSIAIFGTKYINRLENDNRDINPSNYVIEEDVLKSKQEDSSIKNKSTSNDIKNEDEILFDGEIVDSKASSNQNETKPESESKESAQGINYIAPNIVVHDSDYNKDAVSHKDNDDSNSNITDENLNSPEKENTAYNEQDSYIDNGKETKDEKVSDTMEKDDINNAVEAALNINNPTIDIDAKCAILMEATTGKILYHKNATERVYPASTTKLMTAIVALDICNPTDEIKVGDEVTRMAIDSTRAYLEKGERLTLAMLLEGLLLPSGNDAAYVVATHVGRVSKKNMSLSIDDAINEFLRLMNEKAKELNLIDTHFTTPDGYDDDEQYTTAYDMAVIGKEALEHELICSIVKKIRTRNVFLSGEDVTWNSSNKLIQNGSGVYYKYAIGLKTGSSSLAGRCLVSAAEKDDRKVISVIMNSTSTGRWEDSLSLLKYGIDK